MPLTDEWIKEQLKICEKAVPPGQLVRSSDARFIAAAREGYPLVLEEVQRLRRSKADMLALLEGMAANLTAMRKSFE